MNPARVLRRSQVGRVLAWSVLAQFAAAAAHAEPYAYITNNASDNVSVIDVATNAVTATIPVGNGPSAVAVNALGTRVYVGNSDSPYGVAVIDTGNNTVITTIPLDGNAGYVAVNPAGTRVYVGLQFANVVKVIDAVNNTVIGSIAISNPAGIDVSPDGTKVYVATDSYGGPLSVIDTATNTVTGSVPIGNIPRGVAVNPTGTRVYVANLVSGTVSVVDTATLTVVATVPVGTSPGGIAVDPTGARVYVANNGSSDVSIIDAATNTPAGSISVAPGYPTGIAINQAGTVIYVAQTQPSRVNVLGSRCKDTTTSIIVGSNPSAFGKFIGPGGPPPPPPPVPLTTHVTGIEVTQAIQDLANSVPLILDKRTYARVYVQSDGAAVEGVTASLSGEGAFASGGGETRVPLGTLVPSNADGPRITVGPNPRRSMIDESFLFELPWAWTNFAALRLHAELSPPGGDAPASCKGDVASAPIHEFRTFTTLKVAFVRLGYVVPGLFTDPADAMAQTTVAEQRASESYMRRLYPVSQLSFAPDFALFDPLLGLFVDRSAPACAILDAESQKLCAYTYISARLNALRTKNNFIDGADVIYGLIPQKTKFTRGACCTGLASAGPANDNDYASHEIGHFLGRQHPVQAAGDGPKGCKHTAVDPNYPYLFTYIGEFTDTFGGFDVGDPGLDIAPSVHASNDNYDIMGYCEPTTWISDYTYKGLAIGMEALHPDITGRAQSAAARTTAPPPPVTGDWLLVYGQIAADLSQAAFFDIERVGQVFDQPPRPPGPFSIRLLDGVGATLADYSFAPVASEDSTQPGGTGGALLGFGHVVPFVAGTHEVRIINTAAADAVLASAPVSAHAPSVGNVDVQTGPDPVTGSVTLAWTAADVDGDPLHFDLYLARNGGAMLQPLQFGLSETSATIDTRALGGGSVQFRVVANDGLQTASADSALLVLPNRPPQPRILAPGDEARFTAGQVINLDGSAYDPQDGDLGGASLAWSAGQIALGTGPHVSVANLPIGPHALTLTATDSFNLAATSTVTVKVVSGAAIPGPTLTAGPAELGWHVDPGEVQVQTTALEIGNRGNGALQFHIASSAPWLTPNVSSGAAPATITLSGDPAGLIDGTFKDAVLKLTADGFPDQVVFVSVRMSMGDTFDTGNARAPVPTNVVFRGGFE